jgi:hypothetical protein
LRNFDLHPHTYKPHTHGNHSTQSAVNHQLALLPQLAPRFDWTVKMTVNAKEWQQGVGLLELPEELLTMVVDQIIAQHLPK